MSVLLVNPPTLAYVEAQGHGGKLSYWELECRATSEYWTRSFPGEHLGLMSLLASLRAHGIRAACVNGQTLNHRTVDETWAAMLNEMSGEQPAIVGFSGPCQVFMENLELARKVRQRWPNTLILMGHDFATLNHERILAEYDAFDGIVLGEGEATLAAVAEAVETGRAVDEIPGTAWRRGDGKVAVTSRAVEPLDLDSLPWPTRDETERVIALGLSPCVFTSRGCLYRCTYCTTGQVAGLLHRKFGYRERSVGLVADEIEWLVRDYRVPHVTIVDDLFVTRTPESQERARQFATELRARNLNVPFMFDCRLDSIDFDTFRELRDVGAHRVFIGIETGSADQLLFYNKRYGVPYDIPYVRNRIEGLRELGLDVLPGILTYHPQTTARELRDTVDLIDACGYDTTWNLLRNVFAHPGTTLWRQFKNAGLLSVEWPVPKWEFADSRAQRLKDSLMEAVSAGAEYPAARAIFERMLDEWERELVAEETSSAVA